MWSVVRRLQRGSARTTLGTEAMGVVSVAQQAELPDLWQSRTRLLSQGL
jgi:hypothetical protein